MLFKLATDALESEAKPLPWGFMNRGNGGSEELILSGLLIKILILRIVVEELRKANEVVVLRFLKINTEIVDF